MKRRVLLIILVFVIYELICGFKTKEAMKYAHRVMEGETLLTEDANRLSNIQYHIGDHYSASVDISLIPILYFITIEKGYVYVLVKYDYYDEKGELISVVGYEDEIFYFEKERGEWKLIKVHRQP